MAGGGREDQEADEKIAVLAELAESAELALILPTLAEEIAEQFR